MAVEEEDISPAEDEDDLLGPDGHKNQALSLSTSLIDFKVSDGLMPSLSSVRAS